MIGELVGSYRVERKLGAGGMGVVYVAEHPLLRKKAVVKFLHADLSSNEEFIERFFNEARSATMIRHPGIVDVFDFGHHESGCAFILMEFLEGRSLADQVKEGTCTPSEAILLCRQIASAVGAAHVQGIVHRDLKPDNVFLVTDREAAGGARVKVLDFGIAKLAGDTAGAVKTQTGAVMGTPTYMAPEQCRSAGEVDHRADIYSLGCILFELVCGRPPFVTGSLGQLIAAHMFEPPPAPSSLAPVPADLERVIVQALAKDARDRQRSMAELADQLAACDPTVPADWKPPAKPRAGTEPTVAMPPQLVATTLGTSNGQIIHAVTTPPVTAPTRRPRWIAPVAAVAAIGIGVAIWQLSASKSGEPVAVAAPAPVVAPQPPPPPKPEPVAEVKPPPPKHVTLAIHSKPEGADVLQELDGIRIGRTPYERSFAPIPHGAVVYVLRLDGYEEARVELATDRDDDQTISLAPKKKPRGKPIAVPPKPPVDEPRPPAPPPSDGMLRPK